MSTQNVVYILHHEAWIKFTDVGFILFLIHKSWDFYSVTLQRPPNRLKI